MSAGSTGRDSLGSVLSEELAELEKDDEIEGVDEDGSDDDAEETDGDGGMGMKELPVDIVTELGYTTSLGVTNSLPLTNFIDPSLTLTAAETLLPPKRCCRRSLSCRP